MMRAWIMTVGLGLVLILGAVSIAWLVDQLIRLVHWLVPPRRRPQPTFHEGELWAMLQGGCIYPTPRPRVLFFFRR